MTGRIAPLSADPDDFCIFDTETRALAGLADPEQGNLPVSGAHHYARGSKVTILTYAIGHAEPKLWALADFDSTLRWADAPGDLAAFFDKVDAGRGWFAAFNSGFDRAVVNHGMVRTSRLPEMEIDHVIDVMAQAAASGLPANLDGVSKALRLGHKQEDGKHLIRGFCVADGWTPQSHPEEWERFCTYALQDTALTRDILFNTRPLARFEWEEFWASEDVNDRGLPVDRHYVERAAVLAADYEANLKAVVTELSGGDLYSIRQHAAIAQWLHDKLEHLSEATEILVSRYDEDDTTGEYTPAALSAERSRVERLIAYLTRLDAEQGLTDDEAGVLDLLDERLYGASTTPGKFAKMLPMIGSDNRLRGQYVFNGAAATGRYSSRGVQMHNLTRTAEKREAEMLDWINEEITP